MVDYQSTVWGIMFMDSKGEFNHENALWLYKSPIKYVLENTIIQQKIKSIQIVDTILDSPLSSGDVCVVEFDQLTLEEASQYFFDAENVNVAPPVIKVVVGRWTKFLANAHGNFKTMFYGTLQNADWCYKEDGIYIKAIYKNYVWDALEKISFGETYHFWEGRGFSISGIIKKILTSYRLGELFKEEDIIFNVLVEKTKTVLEGSLFPGAPKGIGIEKTTVTLEEAEEFYNAPYEGQYNKYFDKSLKCFFGYLARDFGCMVTMIGGNFYFGKRTQFVPASKVFVYGSVTKRSIAALEYSSLSTLTDEELNNTTMFDSSFESITVDYKQSNVRATDVAFSFDASPKMSSIKAEATDQAKNTYVMPSLIMGKNRFWHQLQQIGVDEYISYLKKDTGEIFTIGAGKSVSLTAGKKDLNKEMQNYYEEIKKQVEEENKFILSWKKVSPRSKERQITERMQLKKADALDVSKRITVRGARGDQNYYIPQPFIVLGVHDKHSTKYSPVQIVHTIDNNGYKMDVTGVAQLGYKDKEWNKTILPPVNPEQRKVFVNKTPKKPIEKPAEKVYVPCTGVLKCHTGEIDLHRENKSIYIPYP
jgi:hypothetical protein